MRADRGTPGTAARNSPSSAGGEAAPLSHLLQVHAVDQDVVHQRRSVGTELPLDTQHGLALAFRDGLACLYAIDIFARGIDGLRPALRPLPVMLEPRPPLYCASSI